MLLFLAAWMQRMCECVTHEAGGVGVAVTHRAMMLVTKDVTIAAMSRGKRQ